MATFPAVFIAIGAVLATSIFSGLDRPPGASTNGGDPVAVPAGETLADLAAAGWDPDAAETCGSCHTDIYSEWKGRAHASAWTDPIYREAIKAKKRPKLCHNCHIPASVLERLGRKPRTRDTHLDEGVTCVSCHKQDDKMHGPFGAKTEAHPSVKNEAFTQQGSTNLCASCHAAKIADVLPVAKDFLRAGLDKKGKSCTGCHMPAVERHVAISPATGRPTGEKRMGRRHIVLGPKDVEFCGKAFEFAVEKREGRVQLQLTNAAGHGVPGLVGLRRFPMTFRLVDGAGQVLHEQQLEISSDNLLQVEETRMIEIPPQDGAVALEVSVDHVFQGEKIATVLQRKLPLE